MEFNRDNTLNRSTTAKKAVGKEEGLRAYRPKVYNYRATGVLQTGIKARPPKKRSVVTEARGSKVALTEFGKAI
jgi:hypothetical protein